MADVKDVYHKYKELREMENIILMMSVSSGGWR